MLQALEQEDCLRCLALVWLTLQLTKSRRRWAQADALSDGTRQLTEGFVSMIVRGYLEKRWAWYPLDRLHLEVIYI